ncbi:MAG TPA: hypothetical protein VE093_32925 [Polyangiaceae bacterium]|nr:hypothetical protein [Polyangiaceae bacterium]
MALLFHGDARVAALGLAHDLRDGRGGAAGPAAGGASYRRIL